MPTIDLTGRPIVITGASSGIGAATAVACARAGMPVVLGARRMDKLESVVERIRGGGGRAAAVAMDVTDPGQCAAMIERCVAEFGSVYGVYANAGYGDEVAVADMSDATLRAMFETNYFGSLNVIRPALERMKKNPGPHRGHVLWCSSCLGKFSIPMYGVYCATKAAQAHTSRAMNVELRSQGIFSTSVHPIGTRTEFFDQMRTRAPGGSISEHTPQWFMQSPDFVARQTLAALRRPRAEVWTGLTGALVRTGMALGTMFPGVAEVALRRMVR